MRSQHVTRGDVFERVGLSLMITMNSIKYAYQKFDADHCIFALEGKSWRKDFYPQYKANRAVKQMDRSSEEIEEGKYFMDAANDFMNFIKEHTNCTVLRNSNVEADDFIARFIQILGTDPENSFVIVSSDSDFVQLLAPNVDIYDGVNKKIYKAEGMFDDKFKPLFDKKGKPLDKVNPEFFLFEKCVRGDSTDNVPSAVPGVRTNGSAKKIGITEAFADRNNQGFTWINFMKSKWEDPMGVEHIVENDYKRNQILIDLTKQPDEIKDMLDQDIADAVTNPKKVKDIGMQFLKFCAKYELNKLAEYPDSFVKIFNKGI